jgi:uncharacterized protein YbjT (DUF2867 family)
MMRLTIFGATGKTGRLLCEGALAQGCQVTAFARNPAKLDDLADQIEIVAGTLEDVGAIMRAIAGAQAVVSALGTFDRKPNTVLSEGTRQIVRAMEASGVMRLVAITSLGCGSSRTQVNSWVMRLLIKTLAREIWADKDRQEEVIKASSLDYLIVRPGGLTDKPARGSWTVLRPGEKSRGRQMIPRADVAAYILERLVAGELGREEVVLF